METQFITIQVSAPKYWGFQYRVPTMYAINTSSDNLVQELKTHMKNFFSSHNLQELKEGVDKLDLHIHHNIQQFDTVVYACYHPTEDQAEEKKN